MGDPAPLGLLAFATTTALLMYVDMEWVEPEFKEMVWGYAVWYGGIAQLIVGILELLKGNTFGGTAFSSYGCFWLGWASMWIQYREATFEGASAWLHGETLWFATWGVITFGFWIITLKKNLCLITVFGLLDITFWLLVFGVFNEDIKRIAGYAGFATALAAAYTAFAELFAHEWGTHPFGLAPMVKKGHSLGVKGALDKRVSYDGKSNTLMIDLRDLVVVCPEDVAAINAAIREKASMPGNKVNAVVNYHGFHIAPDMTELYRKMVMALHREFYASVTRLHADIFAESQPAAWFHSADRKPAEQTSAEQALTRPNGLGYDELSSL